MPNIETNYIGNGNELNNSIKGGDHGDDILSGFERNDILDGGLDNDTLVRADDDDLLIGRGGNDRLLGGAGTDQFRFSSSSEGIDAIVDFATGDDSIRVRSSDFGGGLTRGVISADQFCFHAFALNANDRFIYFNGVLSFDADGTGESAQIQIATLVGAPSPSAVDIVVF